MKYLTRLQGARMGDKDIIKELTEIRDNLTTLSNTIFNNTIKSIKEVNPERTDSLLKQQKKIDKSITTLTEIIIQLLETKVITSKWEL